MAFVRGLTPRVRLEEPAWVGRFGSSSVDVLVVVEDVEEHAVFVPSIDWFSIRGVGGDVYFAAYLAEW